MFQKLLVANRGEIAVRVILACRALGIRTVAVHSEADAAALHVRLADESHACGPAPARESYLDAERIVAIARRTGADALHPGYGFLSENPELAERCADAGVTFVGPSPSAIRVMGDKVSSRRTAEAAGVPPVPGADQVLSDAELAAVAHEIGYPVMVKASAGGGGRGLRVVRDATGLDKAVERARMEARAAFGRDDLYVEKWIEAPRHVEVQVLSDSEGRTFHLFERDCSIQRRHQKLLEESPAPGVSAELRARMGEAAVAVSTAVDYRGAGTCEFLLDASGTFYFLEMNTRIQVEHPVTEAVTGVDLVQEQIRIAAGAPLACDPERLQLAGHAIEARICAENPSKKFLPSPGRIETFEIPTGDGIRVDTGVEAGSDVTVHYDPLLAKLIAHGSDRQEAIERLDDALARFRIDGIATTVPFHRELLRDEAFRAGRYDTSWVEGWQRAARSRA